jgi:hypothetical protein
MLLPLGAQVAAKGFAAIGYQQLAQKVGAFHGIKTGWALAVVAVVLTSSLIASLIWPGAEHPPIQELASGELEQLKFTEDRG